MVLEYFCQLIFTTDSHTFGVYPSWDFSGLPMLVELLCPLPAMQVFTEKPRASWKMEAAVHCFCVLINRILNLFFFSETLRDIHNATSYVSQYFREAGWDGVNFPHSNSQNNVLSTAEQCWHSKSLSKHHLRPGGWGWGRGGMEKADLN